MNTKVYVAAISDPKNGNLTIKRLELRQEIEKPITSIGGKIGFLMAGATGPKGTVNANIERRVCWENISLQKLQEIGGLKVGDVLTQKVGHECRIKVTETIVPQFEGHAPKINPTTGEVLKTANGKNIYRSSTLTFDTVSDPDALVSHVAAPMITTSAPSTVFTSIEAIQS